MTSVRDEWQYSSAFAWHFSSVLATKHTRERAFRSSVSLDIRRLANERVAAAAMWNNISHLIFQLLFFRLNLYAFGIVSCDEKMSCSEMCRKPFERISIYRLSYLRAHDVVYFSLPVSLPLLVALRHSSSFGRSLGTANTMSIRKSSTINDDYLSILVLFCSYWWLALERWPKPIGSCCTVCLCYGH